MIPAGLAGYFTAAVGAAAALIGLLFVVVSLRGDIVAGTSDARSRALVASTFVSLVNAFFVSLVALIPGAHFGIGAMAMALVSLVSTARGPARHAGFGRQWLFLGASATTYLTELVMGFEVVRHPHRSAFAYAIAYLTVAAFAVGLARAWELLKGSPAVAAPPAAAPAAPAPTIAP